MKNLDLCRIVRPFELEISRTRTISVVQNHPKCLSRPVRSPLSSDSLFVVVAHMKTGTPQNIIALQEQFHAQREVVTKLREVVRAAKTAFDNVMDARKQKKKYGGQG